MKLKISTKLNIAWSRQKTPLEAHLGQILGPCWTKLGRKLDQVGASWAKMEPSWAKLALSWAKLEQRWAKLEPSGSQVGQDGQHGGQDGQVGPNWGQVGAKKHQRCPAEVRPVAVLGFGDLQEFGRICQAVQHSCTPSGAPDLRRPQGESPAPPPSRMDLCACIWACWFICIFGLYMCRYIHMFT